MNDLLADLPEIARLDAYEKNGIPYSYLYIIDLRMHKAPVHLKTVSEETQVKKDIYNLTSISLFVFVTFIVLTCASSANPPAAEEI